MNNDDLSRFVGSAEAKLETISKQVDAATSERKTLKTIVEKNAQRLSVIEQKVDVLDPLVKELLKLKWKIMGVLLGLSIAGAALGALISSKFRNLLMF